MEFLIPTDKRLYTYFLTKCSCRPGAASLKTQGGICEFWNACQHSV